MTLYDECFCFDVEIQFDIVLLTFTSKRLSDQRTVYEFDLILVSCTASFPLLPF